MQRILLSSQMHPKNDTPSLHPNFSEKETRNQSSPMSQISAKRCIVSPNTLSNSSLLKWVQQEVSMVQDVLLSKVVSSRNRLRTCFGAIWSNTLLAKPVNHQIRFLLKKTVSSSWPVNRVGVGGQLILSRVDSRRKLGREVRIRRVDMGLVGYSSGYFPFMLVVYCF